MDLAAFRGSLGDDAPDIAWPLPLQALWWDAKGDWAKAHACAQDDRGPDGAAVHAYLHRKEPDLSNARYWYNRANRQPFSGGLEQEWAALVGEWLPN